MSLQENKFFWKPPEMCRSPEFESTDSVEDFYIRKKAQLDQVFGVHGLTVREVEERDHDELKSLAQDFYSDHSFLTPFWMYQVFSFGSSILVEDSQNRIKGYILEVSYLKDRISHGASMALHPDLGGHSLGTHLFMYSSIIAMKRGAVLKKGTISPDNFPSVASIVNGCGAIGIDYADDLFGMGPRLVVALPLIPHILNNNSLSKEKTKAFLSGDHSSTVSQVDPADRGQLKMTLSSGNVIIGLFEGKLLTCPMADLEGAHLLDKQPELILS